MNNANAREAALSVIDNFEPQPTSLISYQSNGQLIVIGENDALAYCRHWQKVPHITYVSITDSDRAVDTDIQLKQRNVEIEGYLGAFVLKLVDSFGNTETLQADIVLDLNVEPIIKLEILPPGYFHTEINEQNSTELEAEIAEQAGEFEKPRYFSYNPSICAHGVNGKVVCHNCIDACPAGAIQSIVEQIEVNPYLCQGGGSCATVCPSGAIQYAYPKLSDSGNQIRQLLQAYRQQEGEQPIILFHTEHFSAQALMQENDRILPVRVEELASVGAELCLSALAYGAAQVVLLADTAIPKLSLNQLNQQVGWLQVVLKDLGMSEAQISIQSVDEKLPTLSTSASFEPAVHNMAGGKRDAFYQALDHLVAQLKRIDVISELPQPAPFGTALIDEKKCTLCMACVGACPGKALQDGSNRELPEVFFIEDLCLQCGACVKTCPEDAIVIAPRLVFDRELRNRSRALNSDEPFACIECGKPFAPTSVINKMQDRLKDHYMFNTSRALDRLKMCEDCRVVDIVQDPEALKGNFDPLN